MSTGGRRRASTADVCGNPHAASPGWPKVELVALLPSCHHLHPVAYFGWAQQRAEDQYPQGCAQVGVGAQDRHLPIEDSDPSKLCKLQCSRPPRRRQLTVMSSLHVMGVAALAAAVPLAQMGYCSSSCCACRSTQLRRQRARMPRDSPFVAADGRTPSAMTSSGWLAKPPCKFEVPSLEPRVDAAMIEHPSTFVRRVRLPHRMLRTSTA